MLDAVPKVVASTKVDAWKFYLWAFWLSGLRLSESLTLRPDAISVDWSGRRTMLRIPAAVEKVKRVRVLPITPDFAELLKSVPPDKRRGRLFSLLARPEKVSAIISKIGKKAGVGVTEKKLASPHDLRRAFGTRWSRSLSPARLRAIMRHADISTTMRYYVDEASEELSDALFATIGTPEVPTKLTSGQNGAAEQKPGEPKTA